MYDHELTVVIQQERERAIQEAMLHHRYGLAALSEGRSLLSRLRDRVRPRRPSDAVPPITEQARTTDACLGQAGVRRGTPG